MATQGPNLPTTGANNGAGALWTNPSAITVGTDAALAGSSGTTTSAYLLGTGFGFSIPNGASIDGIQITLREADPDGGATGTVVPFKAGSAAPGPVVSSPGNALPTTNVYGTSTSLWGTTWTPNDINDSSFGAAVQTSTGNPQYIVYWMKITIYYTEAPGGFNIALV